MAEKDQKNSCSDEDIMFPHGSESCKDVYCFICNDGKWEAHPWVGTVMDLSQIL